MTETKDTTTPLPKYYMALAIGALLWNLLGVGAFFMDTLMSEEAIAALPEAEQELRKSFPIWTKVVYGLAVFPGLIGAIGLLVKKEFATLFFLISLIAVLLQMGYTLFMTDVIEVRGMGAAVMPVLVILIAGYLYYFSMKGIQRGWLTDFD